MASFQRYIETKVHRKMDQLNQWSPSQSDHIEDGDEVIFWKRKKKKSLALFVELYREYTLYW